jgi:hypothetical protein
MAYVKRVSNAINTSTSVNNQVSSLFSMTRTSSTPQIVFAQQLDSLRSQTQPLLTETNPLSSNLVVFDNGDPLSEVIEEMQSILAQNADTLSEIQTGGISSISVADGITSIQGTTRIEQLQFSDDPEGIYQSTAFTSGISASLEQFGNLFTTLGQSIESIELLQSNQTTQLTQLDASYTALAAAIGDISNSFLDVSAQINAVSIQDLSAVASALTENTATLSDTYSTIQTQFSTFPDIITTLDASFANLNSQVTSMDSSLTDAFAAIHILSDWDASLASIDASVQAISLNTQYINTDVNNNIPATRISSNTVVLLPEEGDLSSSGFSIQSNAPSQPPHYLNWIIGAPANGLVQAGDVAMVTNCSGIAFTGIAVSALKGLRIGLDDTSSILQGSDLSIHGNVFVSGDIACSALTTGQLITSGITKTVQDVSGTNAIALNYSIGDTFQASSGPTANFSINITNIPDFTVSKLYTIVFYYMTNYTPTTTITVRNVSNTVISPSAPIYYDGAALSATSGALKKCTLTFLYASTTAASNRLTIQLSNFTDSA